MNKSLKIIRDEWSDLKFVEYLTLDLSASKKSDLKGGRLKKNSQEKDRL